MLTIKYVNGDAAAPLAGNGAAIIAHVCNDVGGWGRGFVLALSQRWQEPERSYRQWYRERSANDFDLGAVQLVLVEPGLWVANIIGQHDIRATDEGPPVRYWAIEAGLADLADEADAMGAIVHMPRIGCGLAGGEWPTVEAIIKRTGAIPNGIVVRIAPIEALSTADGADWLVSIWYAQATTIADETVVDDWRTVHYRMQWEDETWKIADFRSERGPMPGRGSQPPSASPVQFEAILTGFTDEGL